MFQNDCWADASGEMNFNMALPQIEDDFEDETATPEAAQTNEFLRNIPTSGPFKIIVEIKGNLSNKFEKSFLQNQISNSFQIDAKVDYKQGHHHFTLIFSDRDKCSQAQKLNGSQIDRNNLSLIVSRSEQTAFMRKVNTATKTTSHINRFSRDNRQNNNSQDGRLRGQPNRQVNTRYQRKHNFPVGGSIRKNRGKHKSSRIQSNNTATRKDVWKNSNATRDNFREISSSRIPRNKADPTRENSTPQERNESRFSNNSRPRRDRRGNEDRRPQRESRDERSDKSERSDGGRFRRNFREDREKDARPRDLNRNEGRAEASSSWRRPIPSANNERKSRRSNRVNRQTSMTEDGFSSTKKTVSRNRAQPKKKQEESLPVTKHQNAFAGLDDDSD